MNDTDRTNKRHIPELLAPAGGLAQLRAAVNNGADAVYLGGARFNARAKAENFTLPALRDAVRYAHQRNVKVYVTFNTLLRDRELPAALEYAGCLWDIGADAVIVADAGLIRLLGKHLPDLPLHLSTQGTVTGPGAVPIYRGWGIRRIVPARELTLEEIRAMAAACHGAVCELEVFAHGALCMCYSGQCQMSRVLGGGSARSGNRGLCAQPCRLPYTDDRGRTGYFLSPRDLCLLGEIPALCQAGVDSLKIEGRLKSPEYVAVVTSVYRKYLDQYAAHGEAQVSAEDWAALRQIYSRGGFTTGYLYGNPGQDLLSGTSPKHTGIYVGTVRDTVSPKRAGRDKTAAAGAARKGAALVDLVLEDAAQDGPFGGIRRAEAAWGREALQEGDGVEFRPEAPAPVRRGPAGDPPQKVGTGNGSKDPGGLVTFLRRLPDGIIRIGDMKGRIRPGDAVYRVSSRAQLEAARASFEADDMEQLDRQLKRPIPLAMTFTAASGRPVRLQIRELAKLQNREAAGREAGDACDLSVCSESRMEDAQKRPAEAARIRTQLLKLGGTPFTCAPEDIRVDLDGVCAVPVSVINALRREGIRQLLEEKGRVRRTPVDMEALESAGAALDPAPVQKPASPETLLPLMTFMAAADPGAALPYIEAVSKGKLDIYIEENFAAIVQRLQALDRGILIRTSSWVQPFLDAGVRVYGGCGLNVYNRQAQLAWEDLGVEIAEASLEAAEPGETDIPLMITEHPVRARTLRDRKGCVHRVERIGAGDKTIIW